MYGATVSAAGVWQQGEAREDDLQANYGRNLPLICPRFSGYGHCLWGTKEGKTIGHWGIGVRRGGLGGLISLILPFRLFWGIFWVIHHTTSNNNGLLAAAFRRTSGRGACTGPGEHHRPVARHIRRRLLWPGNQADEQSGHNSTRMRKSPSFF